MVFFFEALFFNLKTPPLRILYLLYIPEKIRVYSGFFCCCCCFVFKWTFLFEITLDIWRSCKAICKVREHSTESPSLLIPFASSELPKTILSFYIHLEKEMATHSSILAWRIPGMAEPGGLPSVGSHRVGHDWSDLALALALERGIELTEMTPSYSLLHYKDTD